MKVAVLGTGMVGRAHAARLTELGHEVLLGTQNVDDKLASAETDAMGNPPFSEWHKDNSSVKLVPFTEATEQGEMVINALSGQITLEVLKGLETSIGDKIIIDIANPLDFSNGMPPTLSICNTDSLGEQIQKALPDAKIVKTLNTLNASIQVDPRQLADGDHDIFVSGNDESAKSKVVELLRSYGWTNIIDLGDISTSRGTEMLLPIWLRLMGALGTPQFNFKIVK
jgi:predicted dinucleotide-binding enzyme